MTQLNKNWFFNGTLDVEYKKYILLAYLQYVDKHFKSTELYPYLSELVYHYNNLNNYHEKKNEFRQNFPKELKGIDLIKLKLVYKELLKDDQTLATIDKIVSYSLPKIKEYLDNGSEIFNFIEEQINLYELSVMPLYKAEGYLIIDSPKADYLVYGFSQSLIKSVQNSFKSLRTYFVQSYQKNITNTLVNIKHDLIKRYKKLPNPATFVLESSIKVPIEPTLLPIGKRLLLAKLD